MAEPGIHPPPFPTTPRKAPWDHVEELVQRLDRLIALYEGVAPPEVPPEEPPPEWPSLAAVISRLDEILNIIRWQAAEAVQIYRESIRSAGTFPSEMANWKRGKRLLLKVKSTLNQNALIQVTGNTKNTVVDSVNINTALNCAAKSSISVGLAWDDWHPFIGCTITTTTAPTDGELKVEAVIQE